MIQTELNRELCEAIARDDEAAVQQALKRGAQVNARDDQGLTPLRLAASGRDRVRLVRLLLSAGAYVNTIDDEYCYTPLHIAAIGGYSQVASVLIAAGADINATDKRGFTPLHLGARRAHKDVISVLVKANANPWALSDYRERPRDLLPHGHPDIFAILREAENGYLGSMAKRSERQSRGGRGV